MKGRPREAVYRGMMEDATYWRPTEHNTRPSLVAPNSPAHAGGAGSIPGSGRSPGEGNGNPVQYSCLENPMDRGAWWMD